MTDQGSWFRRLVGGDDTSAANLKAELEKQSSVVAEFEAKLEAASAREAAQHAALEELQGQLETSRAEEARTAATLASTEQELEGLRQQLAEERSRSIEATAQIATLTKNAQAAKENDRKRSVKDLERTTQLKELEKTQAALTSRVAELTRQSEDARRGLDRAEKENLELAEKVEVLGTDGARELQTARDESERLGREIAAAAEAVKAATEAQRKAEAERARLAQELALANSSANLATHAMQRAENEQQDTARELAAATASLQATTERFAATTRRLSAAEQHSQVLDERLQSVEADLADRESALLAERADWLELLQAFWDALERALGPTATLPLERTLGSPPFKPTEGEAFDAAVKALSLWLDARHLCRNFSASETGEGIEVRLEATDPEAAPPSWLPVVAVQWLGRITHSAYRATDTRWNGSEGTVRALRLGRDAPRVVS